ncbi:GAF domain-containing protein [Kovacikia minuta CCNUW1]|uniref:GAF domain-containing protein n=1 Tax=Kovacikia minuta TaxID=2931930 RepID=UPI001CC91DEB|nr:GAF domain-containing protein [Kovacikia minuta]UBF28299.1 GAF domain-containing protein [Kovacikia minuta CCNUW1]
MKLPLPDHPSNGKDETCQYRTLDGGVRDFLDDLVQLAIVVSDTPIALVWLLNDDRLHIQAGAGLEMEDALHCAPLCSECLLHSSPLVVADTHTDQRFALNPAVIGTPQLRFFAHVPLLVSGGQTIGTLFVADWVPPIADDTPGGSPTKPEPPDCQPTRTTTQLKSLGRR